MRELVYPRLLLPRVEQLPDKVAFVDVTTEGTRYRGTFASHLDRLLRLVHSTRNCARRRTGRPFRSSGHEQP